MCYKGENVKVTCFRTCTNGSPQTCKFLLSVNHSLMGSCCSWFTTEAPRSTPTQLILQWKVMIISSINCMVYKISENSVHCSFPASKALGVWHDHIMVGASQLKKCSYLSENKHASGSMLHLMKNPPSTRIHTMVLVNTHFWLTGRYALITIWNLLPNWRWCEWVSEQSADWFSFPKRRCHLLRDPQLPFPKNVLKKDGVWKEKKETLASYN